MHEMSRDERRAFLLDGDDLVFTTHETSVKGNAVEGELLVRVTPTKVLGRTSIAD